VIPKSFQLAGRTWKVNFIPPQKAFWPNKDDLGYTDNVKGELYIVAHPEVSRDMHHLTFLHELCHAIWFMRGYGYDDKHDEQEIESVAVMLHQYEKTKRGELDVGS
jgi:hypothetical protein